MPLLALNKSEIGVLVPPVVGGTGEVVAEDLGSGDCLDVAIELEMIAGS